MRYLMSVFVLTLLCWGISLPADAWQQGFLFWRGQGVQLTGVLAVALIGLLLLMATRPRWLEQRLGGLDHLYQLHKWTGISAGSLVLLHWILTKAPRWVADWGLLQLGPKPPRMPDAWRGLFKDFGEYAFYGMVLFIIISLVKVLPYGRFRMIHKAGAILALLAGLHSLYLLNPDLRWTAFGLIAQGTSLLAIGCGLWSLSGRIGRRQKYPGEIVSLRELGSQTLEVEIALPRTFGADYQPGQFALLTLESAEGAHPFTIVRYQPANGHITFAIKGLGDYTRELPARLKVGMPVQVEGPYGRFRLPESLPSQYWIAGGIGITPFVAWLDALVQRGEQRTGAHLLYCVNREQDALYAERLRELAEQAGVQMTLLIREQQGLLDVSQLPTDAHTRYWFCGPKGMRDLLLSTLRPGSLRYEQFDFR